MKVARQANGCRARDCRCLSRKLRVSTRPVKERVPLIRNAYSVHFDICDQSFFVFEIQ